MSKDKVRQRSKMESDEVVPSIDMAGSDIQQIEEESKQQELPKQEQIFAVAKRVRSRLTHLPDPTRPPLGFVPGRGFDVVFPFIRLPELRPTLNGDWVQFGSPELEPNLLYYGDNLHVLRTLPSESIDLIYIDPPFFSGAQYNMIWGDANEVRAFNDIWEGGLDTYLIWLNARLWEMRRVLNIKSSALWRRFSKKLMKLRQSNKKEKAFVDKLTQSILAKAFRGELVPQDPDDEPVSALLEIGLGPTG